MNPRNEKYIAAADRLSEIKDELKELITEARKLLYESTGGDIIYERARGYWIAHIEGALDADNDWLGGSMFRMQDTIDELNGEGDEEDAE